MSWEISFVLIVVVAMLICLFLEVARPEFIVSVALAVLLLSGIVSPEDAVAGFSNEGMLTVGLLFIVAGAVQKSGVLNQIMAKALGSGLSPKKSLIQMMVPISSMSAFLNNTPMVVMFTPVVRKWCEDHNISPSRFLLPLSYAAIFGGTLTLIGTSTNLVIHGFMIERGMEGFGMFQLAIVGLPACVLGIIYMVTIGDKLMPTRRSSIESFLATHKEYLAEAVVEKSSPLAHKTIEEAGLRNLNGLYLIEIIRGTERIAPVAPYTILQEEDRLIFTGLFSTIVELQNIKGIKVETGSHVTLHDLKNGSSLLVEAVVSHHSTLVNSSVKQSKFRTTYGASVIAVHRNDERVSDKVGDIVLRPGDTLLLLCNKDFLSSLSESHEFYLISPVEQPNIIDPKHTIITMVTLISMITAAAFGLLSMFKAAVIAVVILLVTKSIRFEETKRFMQFDVLLLIASAIGIGLALENTGAAEIIANNFVQLSSGAGVIGALIVVYALTSIFTEIITNNAAAVLMFPIAHAIAEQLGQEPIGFFVAIAIAASASFATPIGYQTNLIVYGPGGYRFSDYLKIGIPLNILYLIVTVAIVHFVWII